jgi:uncharacterized protein (TIGR00725 family)
LFLYYINNFARFRQLQNAVSEVTVQILVAVVGSARASKPLVEAAFEAGREIVKAGYALLCGGLGGVMEAACRGAMTEAGRNSGRIIGILPGTDKLDANPYADIVIPTGIGYARNSIVACASDAMIAVGGGSGTMSEIALAWQYGKFIVVIEGLPGTAGGLVGKPLDDRRSDTIAGAATAAEAVALVRDRLRS